MHRRIVCSQKLMFIFVLSFSLDSGFAVRFSFFRCARKFANISLMRVCFDGLCFASRRTAAVDEETQTVPEFHDTGGGGHTNFICADSNNSSNLLADRTQTDSKDTTDSSHKIGKNHCNAQSTARSKLLSLLTLNNIDRKLFFIRNKMDSHDAQLSRVQNPTSNTFDIDLVNRTQTNNMVCMRIFVLHFDQCKKIKNSVLLFSDP